MDSHITWPYQVADQQCRITWVYSKRQSIPLPDWSLHFQILAPFLYPYPYCPLPLTFSVIHDAPVPLSHGLSTKISHLKSS